MQLKATHITIQILITVINNHSYQNMKTLNLLRVWIIQAPSLSQPCMCNNCDGGGRITLLKPHRSHNYMNNHFGHLAHFIVPNCIVCTLFGTCTWTIAPFHTILLLWSTLFESLNTSALMAGDPISKFPSFEIPKNYWCLQTNQPTDEQAKFFKEMYSNVETECKTLTRGLSGSKFTALSGGGACPSFALAGIDFTTSISTSHPTVSFFETIFSVSQCFRIRYTDSYVYWFVFFVLIFSDGTDIFLK